MSGAPTSPASALDCKTRPLRRNATNSRVQFSVLLALLLTACGSAEKPVDYPKVPLSEERAAHLIARTLRDANTRPSKNIPVELAEGRVLNVDLGDLEKGFGVAYVTRSERLKLGDALPPFRPNDDSLTVVRAPGGEPILILHAEAYTYDDARGDEHEHPTVNAERKLQRDVRDFLVHMVQ